MKLTIQEIQEVLNKQVQDPKTINSILKELEQVVSDKKEEKENSTLPKRKNDFAIIVLDEEGELEGKSLTGYVVKYKSDDDSGAILAKLSGSARLFNETKKGKKSPLMSIFEIFGHLKPKFLKMDSTGIIIQTKEPVRIIISNNKLV